MEILKKLTDNFLSMLGKALWPDAEEVVVVFDETVSPDSSVNIVAECPTRFTPTRFLVDCPDAPHFLITDVKISRNSQLTSTGAVPAETFGPATSPLVSLRMDTAEPRDRMVVSVTNASGSTRRFKAQLSGWSS